ncbi:MAG: hypothetical protein JO117_02390 [Verrucomicrobia bacterium]|nr:hypothetical protein [Verrucomicrobiota bacterium]MBV9659167.1 hypothetical protein [Verrucomicrobiota bacterium]
MNKLTKDQIQKIFLSSLLMAGLIYCYFVFLIGPLNASQERAKKEIADLDAKIAASSKRLGRMRSSEEQARLSSNVLDQVNAMIPAGEPIAWFPPRMRAFFDRQGIKETTTRLDRREKLSEELGDFALCYWTIELPAVEFTPFGIALAGLENEEPLLEITRVAITTTLENPEKQHISLGATTVLH